MCVWADPLDLELQMVIICLTQTQALQVQQALHHCAMSLSPKSELLKP